MFNVSAGFKTKLDDPQEIADREFQFPEPTLIPIDDYEDLGSISIEQYEGDQIRASELNIQVDNNTKQRNSLISDKTNFGKTAKIRIGFDAEWIDRYVGFLSRARFWSDNKPRVAMTFTGKGDAALEQLLGSNDVPLTTYSAAAWNPADLAWELLTTEGGLDSTTSTANTDIDYTSWLAYQGITSDLTFRLRGQFEGTTIAEALRLISELTDSLIYSETDGKIYFYKFIPTETSSPYLFDDTKAHLDQAELSFNKSRIVNKAQVFYGYNPATNVWAGSATNENATSQTNYGLQFRLFDSKTVWHEEALSAGALGERLVERYGEPLDTVRFSTKRGTQAMIHQIGDVISLDWEQVDYSAKKMTLYGLRGRLSKDEFNVTAEDLGVLGGAFFILDSATNGVLDTNVLY